MVKSIKNVSQNRPKSLPKESEIGQIASPKASKFGLSDPVDQKSDFLEFLLIFYWFLDGLGPPKIEPRSKKSKKNE